MARVRNLAYNGGIVEQPVFNGVNLTKWIHNGIVVWEKGDLNETYYVLFYNGYFYCISPTNKCYVKIDSPYLPQLNNIINIVTCARTEIYVQYYQNGKYYTRFFDGSMQSFSSGGKLVHGPDTRPLYFTMGINIPKNTSASNRTLGNYYFYDDNYELDYSNTNPDSVGYTHINITYPNTFSENSHPTVTSGIGWGHDIKQEFSGATLKSIPMCALTHLIHTEKKSDTWYYIVSGLPTLVSTLQRQGIFAAPIANNAYGVNTRTNKYGSDAMSFDNFIYCYQLCGNLTMYSAILDPTVSKYGITYVTGITNNKYRSSYTMYDFFTGGNNIVGRWWASEAPSNLIEFDKQYCDPSGVEHAPIAVWADNVKLIMYNTQPGDSSFHTYLSYEMDIQVLNADCVIHIDCGDKAPKTSELSCTLTTFSTKMNSQNTIYQGNGFEKGIAYIANCYNRVAFTNTGLRSFGLYGYADPKWTYGEEYAYISQMRQEGNYLILTALILYQGSWIPTIMCIYDWRFKSHVNNYALFILD